MKRSIQTPATRSTLAVLAATALALTLASCSGSGDDDDATASAEEETSEAATDEATDEATESESPTDKASETEKPTETASAEETTPPPAGGGDVAACMLGDWAMDTEAMKAQVEQMLGGMASEMTVSGTSLATITPTSIDSVVDSTSSFSMDLGEAGSASGETTTVGTISLGYTIAGDVLTYGDVLAADGTITSTITMGGVPTTQEIDMAEANAGSTGLTATVTCDDSTLVFTTTSGEVSIAQTFIRR